MDDDEYVNVQCMHFDREGRWTKTVTLRRPIYLAHGTAHDLYKGMWERRNGPMKRGEVLVVANATSEAPLPVLVRASGRDD